MASAEQADNKVQSIYKIGQDRFQPGAFTIQSHLAKVPAGTPFERLLEPQCWAHVAERIEKITKATTFIEVVYDDFSVYAKLLVIDKGATWLKVKVLEHKQLSSVEVEVSDPHAEYEVKWGNTHTGFRIIRCEDGAVVREGFNDKESADVALKEFMKSLKK